MRRNMMTNDPEERYVDAATPSAALIDQGKSMECPTLGEAVMAWRRLSEDRKAAAIIWVSGKVYTADEIDRMHYTPA
jgi:hypothetical protein